MASYQTEQKIQLIQFLKKHKETAFTVDDIILAMKSDPTITNAPGKSTIYRLISKLVSENIVQCYAKSGGEKSSYQMIDSRKCHEHMHLKCTDCGKLLHMSDEESQLLTNQIQSLNNFDLDIHQTLLFGRCGKCKQKGCPNR